jgi:hypothetical protein
LVEWDRKRTIEGTFVFQNRETHSRKYGSLRGGGKIQQGSGVFPDIEILRKLIAFPMITL